MKKVRLWLLVFLCMMAVFQVLLTEELLESAHRRNCFSYETAFRNLRNHNLTKDLTMPDPIWKGFVSF